MLDLARRVDRDLALRDRGGRPRRAPCACRGRPRASAARSLPANVLPGREDVHGQRRRRARRRRSRSPARRRSCAPCCGRRPRRSAVPGRTNAPGSIVRVAISPSNGARRMQSLTSRLVRRQLGALRRRAAPPPTRSAACFCSASFGDDEAAVEQRLHARRLVGDRALPRVDGARLGGDRLARRARVAAVERREHLAALDDRARSDEHRVDVGRDELRPDLGLDPGPQRPDVRALTRGRCVSCAAMTVTGFGVDDSATLLTCDSARCTRSAPTPRTTRTPRR